MSWIIPKIASLAFVSVGNEPDEAASPTEHLSNEQLRQLVVYGIETKLFTAKDVYSDKVARSTFSDWKNSKSQSRKVFDAARAFCNRFFATEPLPAQFARPAEEPAKPAVFDDDDNDAPDDNDNNDDNDNDNTPEDDIDDTVEESSSTTTTPVLDASVSEYAQTAPSGYGDAQAIEMCSWNVLNWSTKTDDARQNSFFFVIQMFDVAVFQEIRLDLLLRRRNNLLSTQIAAYEIAQSPELFKQGSKHKERMVVFYKREMFEALNEEVLAAPGMDRQPFCVTLRHRDTGYVFSVISVHITYGKLGVEPRRAEIALLTAAMARVIANRPKYGEVFLCGDFNLPPTDYAFWPLRRKLAYFMSNPKDKTTVGKDANVYDTWWFAVGSQTYRPDLSDVIYLKGKGGLGDKARRQEQKRGLSDHLPVKISLDIYPTAPQ